MKKLLIAFLFFTGCVTETIPTETTYRFEGTGYLLSDWGYTSPVRKTILTITDSTGTLVMSDSEGEFRDTLTHITVTDGHVFQGTVYGEGSYGRFSLTDCNGVIGEYKTGTTTRIINLK